MKPTEIAFVLYAVKDLVNSRNFYEQILGLKPESVWLDEANGMGMIEYALGENNSHTLAIGNGVEHFTPGNSGATVALEVEDFEQAIKSLKGANVVFKMEPMETPVCHMALLLDLDGNQLMIHKRK